MAACAVLAGLAVAHTASGQTADPLALPPVGAVVDDNSIGLADGKVFHRAATLSIGPEGPGGLKFERFLTDTGWLDNLAGTINSDGGPNYTEGEVEVTEDRATYTVSMNGRSDTFMQMSYYYLQEAGVFVSNLQNGSSLTHNLTTGTYIYRTRDGIEATFSRQYSDDVGQTYTGYGTWSQASWGAQGGNRARVTQIRYPSGEVVDFHYKTVIVNGYLPVHRLQSVTNNFGYQFKLEYDSNTPGTTSATVRVYLRLKKVIAINNAQEYCDRVADSCTLTTPWPYVSFAAPSVSVRTQTDSLGRTKEYTFGRTDSGSEQAPTGIRFPGSTADDIVYTYWTGVASTNPRYRTVRYANKNGSTWSYQVADVTGAANCTAPAPYLCREMTVVDPTSQTHLTHVAMLSGYLGKTSLGIVSRATDPLGRTTKRQVDQYGRVTRVTNPEGDYADYSYDARGNLIQKTVVPKSGSGLASIVTSASYDAVCSNPLTCNQPNSTTDPRGGVTNYTYDAVHGGLLTVTQPAPSAGAVRPQIRNSYTPLSAWYKNSAGVIVQAASPVYLITGTSVCATLATCAGGADEVKSTLAYGASGVANNLLQTLVTTGSGNGALLATMTNTYDIFGNLLTLDGPLAGAGDSMRYIYDAGRRKIGEIAADPDGAGPLKYRAVRTTYNLDNLVTSVEAGTVTAQTDVAWAAFTPLNQRVFQYDGSGRRTKESLAAGGATYWVKQYSYDALDHPLCAAVRMNPAEFASLPTSVCVPGTAGANGPDRITLNTYDAAGQLTQVTNGYGTPLQQNTKTTTYSLNGMVLTVTDAKGYKTTYEYDGFDRLSKTRYPTAANGALSSTTDYELNTYDAASNVVQLRRRDGQTVSYAYDLLNRKTTDIDSVVYVYDNLGRRLSAVRSGATISYGWNALNGMVSETTSLGAVAYQYDLAARRTRVTWPDSFYVTYDYDLAGKVTAVRENGAASGPGVLAAFTYDDLGRRTGVTRGNGVVSSFTYDGASRLDSLSYDLAGTVSDQTWTYSRNARGQIVGRTGSNAAYAAPPPSPGSTSYTPNGLNQITTSGALTLSYDGRGNLTSDGVNSYGYDIANRLTSMSGVTLGYDPVGRLERVTAPSVTRFGYDGSNVIGEYNAAGVLLRRYVHGQEADEPLVWYEGTGTTDRRWLAANNQGSIASVSSGTATAIATNTYNEFGIPSAANQGRFQYTGQLWLPEIGLYHYKARVYSPQLGRFLQTDPLGYQDGMNLYAYVGGDPINKIDPDGTDARWVVDQTTGSVTLVIPVYFTGEGATPAAIAAIETRVEGISIPNSKYSVDVVLMSAPGAGINTLDLSPGYDTTLCGSPGECINKLGGNRGHINSGLASFIDAASHDIFHFAGIRDQYQEGPRDSAGNRTSRPTRGYTDSNIMTARKGTELKDTQFESAKRNSSTTRCQTNASGVETCSTH